MAHSYKPSRTSTYSEDLQLIENGVARRGTGVYIWSDHCKPWCGQIHRSKDCAVIIIWTLVVCPYTNATFPALYTQALWWIILPCICQKQLGTYTLMLEVSLSTICRCLQDTGFTWKRLQKLALQRDKLQYISDVCVYSRVMMVFVNETGWQTKHAMKMWL